MRCDELTDGRADVAVDPALHRGIGEQREEGGAEPHMPAQPVADVGVEGACARHVPGHRGEADREQDQDRGAHQVRRRVGGAVARGNPDGEGPRDDGEWGGGCHHHEDDRGRAEAAGQSVGFAVADRRSRREGIGCHGNQAFVSEWLSGCGVVKLGMSEMRMARRRILI